MFIYCGLFPWQECCKYEIKSPNENARTADTGATVRKLLFTLPNYRELNKRVAIMTDNLYVQRKWLIEAIALQLSAVSFDKFMLTAFCRIAEIILKCLKAIPLNSTVNSSL